MTQKEANFLNALKVAIRASWVAACNQEGIPSDSKFVVFSKDNQEAISHNELMAEFFKERKRIQANINRRERHATLTSLGLKRVRGAQGGVYYE